jgi:hypothetical protein
MQKRQRLWKRATKEEEKSGTEEEGRRPSNVAEA